MRSRPAKASLSCVPIEEIWTSGAATSPVKKMYITKSPSDIEPERMERPADEDHQDPDDAEDEVEPAETPAIAVTAFLTLSKSASTFPAKMFDSRSSAV